MNFLRENSDLCRLAMKKPGLLNRDYIRITQPHFAATLPATVEELYRSLPAALRGFNKTKHKKLLKDFAGRTKIKCFREVAEVDVLAQDVERVVRTSYQRGLGVGFMDSPEMRERLRLKAEKGWLRAYVLYLAERPCAFWIGDMNQGTFGGDYIGYDTEFGKYSPGMFLQTKVIEGFCDGNREGVTAVDFGPGNAQYKELLSNQRWRETSVYIFAPSLKGISLNLVRTLFGGMDQTIKKALARTSLLQRMKKSWRAHVTPKEATQR
jgi:CelD/BcsL family acetyltransferase involved in cellulose biosynthesis